MGVETPLPPKAMNPAAPDGAPPRRINFLQDKPVMCPAVPHEGPWGGEPS